MARTRRLSHEAREGDRGAFLADSAVDGFEPSANVEIRFEPADIAWPATST